MRILVTGGAGYIGSHTSKALYEAGFEPVAFDNLSRGHRSSVRWGPLVEGDLADRELVLQALREYSIGAVIHFAASAYVGESMRHPREYFRNNVANTLNLLDAVLDAGVQHLIVSSSCTVYGEPDHVPIPEEHPKRPISPYGESKLMVENILKWYGEAYGLKWTALRYFNAAGADPDGELGENHIPETHIVPLVIQAALRERPYVDIFGTDYPTEDGTAVRDYIHVSDLGVAHVRALNYLLTGGRSIALNVGTGSGVSVAEIVAAVERVSGRVVPVRRTLRRLGDPALLLADNRRSVAVLGCTYDNSHITRIVETAWQWHTARAVCPDVAAASAGHGVLP